MIFRQLPHQKSVNCHIKTYDFFVFQRIDLKSLPKVLIVISRKIDTDRMNPPSFLMVMTGVGNYAYRRPQDNVLVVPAGCLKD